jgi:DNA ligase 1
VAEVKKDYIGDKGVGDSLDLVLVGALKGAGKRAGVYGSFLLASYEPDSGKYEAASKIGTGFSETELEEIFNKSKDLIIDSRPSNLSYKGEEMDVWFQPSLVWEIKTADFTISPVYTVGMGIVDSERGIGLRFPRFERYREDKKAQEATTSKQIISMYKSQSSVAQDLIDDEDYY